MLLDRRRPDAQQGFGDYLSDLSKSNGFRDIGTFKQFLTDLAKKQYKVQCSFPGVVRVISGLFIGLRIDEIHLADSPTPLCFRCLTSEPKYWVWSVVGRTRCNELVNIHRLFAQGKDNPIANREKYCGLMICSSKKLGFNLSPSEEGRYFADIFSRDEREKATPSRIFPSYKAFTKVHYFRR